MNVKGRHYRTIWLGNNKKEVKIIDQRKLPEKFVIETLKSVDDVVAAIKDMHIRGAGLIGAAAGYGMYLGCLESYAVPQNRFNKFLLAIAEKLKKTRPTAVNLTNAVNRQLAEIGKAKDRDGRIKIAADTAQRIADEDARCCKMIGDAGYSIIEKITKKKGRVNILTHCNAGWLAFVDYGSALAPVYKAFDKGIDIHVWVDETRPKNQGYLTCWELNNQGVPNTLIVDNAGGHLMQRGLVDLVIVGADRVTRNGDVANKIGTYLKALAAKDNHIPFYVAFPSTTFDFSMSAGKDIPIEERDAKEVTNITRAANYAFDVTPANLITGLITERGLCKALEKSILTLYPEHK